MALLADLSMIESGTPDCPYPQRPPPEQGRDICGIPWMSLYLFLRWESLHHPPYLSPGLLWPLLTLIYTTSCCGTRKWYRVTYTSSDIYLRLAVSLLELLHLASLPIFLSPPWLHLFSLLSRTSFSVHLFSVSVFRALS